MMGKKKPMPMKSGTKPAGVMPAGMYADGGKVGKPMKKYADGGMVGGKSHCGPGYVADWNRKDMKK